MFGLERMVWGKMWREKGVGCFAIMVLVILLPCVITLLIGQEAAMPVSGEANSGVGQIRMEENGQRIDLQEYLIGVTAAQLQGDVGVEAGFLCFFCKSSGWF